MISDTITRYIYWELLGGSMILLLILLHNNIVLYKLRLKDYLSIMLISSILSCAAEVLWDVSDGVPGMRVFSYLAVCIYDTSILVFATTFNRYFLYRFGMVPKTKILNWLVYYLPNIAVFIACIVSIWTGTVVQVDEAGAIHVGETFSAVHGYVSEGYGVVVLIVAIYELVVKRKKDPVLAQISKHLIIFAVLLLGNITLQMLILGEYAEDYLSTAAASSISLVYLIMTVNTNNLMAKQSMIDAVESDLRIASNIQLDSIPSEDPGFPDDFACDLRAYMNTAREVGGDFYDYFMIDDKRLCLLIADVSGKGIPAALFMMTAKTTIKDYTMLCKSTAEIFTEVNKRLCENNDSNMFATAWIGIFDTETKMMQFTNAGHNYPLLLSSAGQCRELKYKHGLFLGGMEDIQYKEDEFLMNKGDRLLLFTDGITEAHDSDKNLYGEERLISTFQQAAGENNEKVLESISDSVSEFAHEEPQFDDMTMMILTVR